MQNNVTYLSRKLQRSLDNNYNVIDMPAVIEIISTLEKTSVTKELLETTRLGKYINELRRKTSNESLAKRAKELLKKWRDLILPDANGQIRSSSANSVTGATPATEGRTDDSPKNHHSKKRPASSSTPPDRSSTSKKMLINGQNNREYDFSDNSNCSVKELKKTDVIFINSDSNSSMPESLNPGDHFEVSNDATDVSDATSMQPKKRGRKKGSKNHKNLVIAAEESFTNKMAVSRNSKVKTTQELLADIQNRKPSTQDIELRTAQLTESLSRIEHKLNPQKTIQKKSATHRASIEPGGRSPEALTVASDDEIVDVVGTDPPANQPSFEPEKIAETPVQALTVEHLLGQLPTVDKTCLEAPDEMPVCVCATPKVAEVPQFVAEPEKITVVVAAASKDSLFAPPSPPPVTFFDDCADERTSAKRDECAGDSDCGEENLLCPAKLFLSGKYHLDANDDDGVDRVSVLHETHLPNVNGNFGVAAAASSPQRDAAENIVPNFMSERLHKTPNENFQKYSISISDCDAAGGDVAAVGNSRNSCDSASSDVRRTDDRGPHSAAVHTDFREWHETLDVISYNDELLRILPYVIID